MTRSNPAVATTSLSRTGAPPRACATGQHRHGEHRIGQRGPADGPGDLAGHHRDGQAEAVAARGAAAQRPVRRGDDWVEMRAAGRGEHQDQHGQAERGDQRVDQQPQRAVSGQPGSGDAGPDHHRDQQARPVNSASSRRPHSRSRLAGLTARMMAECIPGPPRW